MTGSSEVHAREELRAQALVEASDYSYVMMRANRLFDHWIMQAVDLGASLREVAAATGRSHSTIAERVKRIRRTTTPEE